MKGILLFCPTNVIWECPFYCYGELLALSLAGYGLTNLLVCSCLTRSTAVSLETKQISLLFPGENFPFADIMILNPLQSRASEFPFCLLLSPSGFFSVRNIGWKCFFRNMCAASICISLTLATSSWCRWVVMMLEANLSVFPPVWWDQTTHLSPQAVQKTYTDTHSPSLFCVLVSVFFSSVHCPSMGSCDRHLSLYYNILFYMCVGVCAPCGDFLCFIHTHLTFDFWFFGRTMYFLSPWLMSPIKSCQTICLNYVFHFIMQHYPELSVCVYTWCATVHAFTVIARHWCNECNAL